MNREEKAETIRIWKAGGGYATELPGFYLWDEDRAEVLRMAVDLQRMAEAQPRLPVAGDCEALDG